MAKGLQKTTVAVQRLLDERLQIGTWLQRLSVAGDTTPEQVRSRVRADYERRLGEVMRELENHSSELENVLDRIRSTESGLAKQEREAAERLAEAELRHTVGEYDEAQWRQVHAGLLDGLAKIRDELTQVQDEIGRLEEVLELIQTPASSAPRAAEAAAPLEPTRREPPAPGRREPAAPARTGKPQRDAFDELAFLRSVTEDESHGPAASRASGSMRAIVDPPAAQPGNPSSQAEGKKDNMPRSSKAVKSLKCNECGTMNLPTEWYCEQCGAELAAL